MLVLVRKTKAFFVKSYSSELRLECPNVLKFTLEIAISTKLGLLGRSDGLQNSRYLQNKRVFWKMCLSKSC